VDYDCVVLKKNGDIAKQIVVGGAGPSGLACGYYLSLKGYKVDIFEGYPDISVAEGNTIRRD
jgi:ribulose 1,5-bisphosphate synthetase/thiazole synthase